VDESLTRTFSGKEHSVPSLFSLALDRRLPSRLTRLIQFFSSPAAGGIGSAGQEKKTMLINLLFAIALLVHSAATASTTPTTTVTPQAVQQDTDLGG
jgi:hypothetical protein